MSDFRSKLPDLKELASMTGKLFTDIKHSVSGIIEEYKKKRATTEEKVETNPAPEKPTTVEPSKPKAAAAAPTASATTPKQPEVKEAPKEETKTEVKADDNSNKEVK